MYHSGIRMSGKNGTIMMKNGKGIRNGIAEINGKKYFFSQSIVCKYCSL